MSRDQVRLYGELASTGLTSRIGCSLITMVEPHVGHEHSYNRWYEDDHFNAAPWRCHGCSPAAAGSRPSRCRGSLSRELRDRAAARYRKIHFDLLGYGRSLRRAHGWTVATNKLCAPTGAFIWSAPTSTPRSRAIRRQLSRCLGARDIHALDILWRPGAGGHRRSVAAGRAELIRWLKTERVPPRWPAPTPPCAFISSRPAAGRQDALRQGVEGVDNRLTLLGSPRAPEDSWVTLFARGAIWWRNPVWAGSNWWRRSSRPCRGRTICRSATLTGRFTPRQRFAFWCDGASSDACHLRPDHQGCGYMI